MKKKTIEKVIHSKMSKWLNSIEDDNLRELVRKNIIVTGGCITSMLLNEDVKDFDIYLKTKEAAIAVAKHYVGIMPNVNASVVTFDDYNKMTEEEKLSLPHKIDEKRVMIHIPSSGVAGDLENTEDTDDVFDNLSEEIKKNENDYRPVFLSPNAITLSGKIQIVIRFYGEAEEIHSNYDFIHATNHFEYEGLRPRVFLRQEALESILAKELFYSGSKYPICSVIRTRKFIKRGWNINAGQYLKMIFQISELDLTDIEVLRDQLVGVDSAYFNMFLDSLSSVDKEKINHQYLTTVIDKIFN